MFSSSSFSTTIKVMEIQFHFYTEHTQKTGHKKLWSQLLKNLFECHTLFRENFNVCSNAFVSGFDLNWARTRQTRKFCNHKKFNVYTYRQAHTHAQAHSHTYTVKSGRRIRVEKNRFYLFGQITKYDWSFSTRPETRTNLMWHVVHLFSLYGILPFHICW